MVDFQYKDSYGVKDLEEIVRLLRAPGGCPWDAEQTHQSIRRNFLEEAYEAVEAIDEGSPEHLKEELGDVLLQVVFRPYGAGGRSLRSGRRGRRHLQKAHLPPPPRLWGGVGLRHRRGSLQLGGAQAEGKGAGHQYRRAGGRGPLPARPVAGREGAEKGALDKLSEELEELKTAVAEGTNVEEELGDLLFSAVNVSRFVKVDTEEALNGATDKFIGRFRKVEEEAARQGRALEGMSLAELDKLWEHAKET